jgi:hypothetical protein
LLQRQVVYILKYMKETHVHLPVTTSCNPVRPASVINFRNPPELLRNTKNRDSSWSTKLGARRLVPSRIVCCLAEARQQICTNSKIAMNKGRKF